MGKQQMHRSSLLAAVMLLLGCGAAIAQNSSSNACPVQFDYVRNFPETKQQCEQGSRQACCSAFINTLGIALAEYLNKTGYFEFADNATATACLREYQQGISSSGINKTFDSYCFPSVYPSTSMFISSEACAGIMNTSDWDKVVLGTGTSQQRPAFYDSCRGDLSAVPDCQSCSTDLQQTVYLLQSRSPNQTDSQCVYVAVLYAAGVINRFGPRNPSTAACLLGVSTPSFKAPSTSKHDIALYAALGVAIPVVLLLVLGGVLYRVYRNRRRRSQSALLPTRQALVMPNIGMIQFTYDELKTGTQNFSDKNFIGEGGYGRVYRGVLAGYGNMEVAVKVMKDSSAESDAEFLNEVEVINRVRHRNLVYVRGGCCYEDAAGENQRILVYDYMPNGCLKDYLSQGSKPRLSWPERRKIAIGTAVGINYLHNEVQPAIIHRDIKPSNILLDEDFNARVADFGLAKLCPEGMTQLTTRVAGTPLYMAIEYALYGHCSEKVDVYSFGILLLELMSGRQALDTTQDNPMHYHIADWAWSLVRGGRSEAVIDDRIRGSGPVGVMERFVLVGVLCAHLLVAVRPPISLALKMLEGDEEIPEIPDRPAPYIWPPPTLDAGDLYSTSVAAVSTIDSQELLR